ncbi:MAG: energy-coupled thiamine transporter ThiT [Catenisphaera adipataccumulans]|jgi:thiamine transporter|uniref:energy-coupled thiamine transporter ThiT n=1 Tax=Catenisphaera adipataccumulans TaxID=700500 RepID=UPI003D91208D
MKNQNQIRWITYLALYAALSVVLKYASQMIPFLQMPQGGSIELEYLAIFIASYHLGWKNGIIVGLLAWLLGFIFGFNNWFLNPMQYLLDYIIPVLVCGAASALCPSKNEKVRLYGGVTIAMILKYASTVLSGVYYWPPEGSVAGTSAAWLYSLSYNAWYNLATLIVCIILVPLFYRALAPVIRRNA